MKLVPAIMEATKDVDAIQAVAVTQDADAIQAMEQVTAVDLVEATGFVH